jgi:uncharacterized protein
MMATMNPRLSIATDRPASPRWLEVLSSSECRSLLASASLGRVGVTVNALPVILPVAYLVDADIVWFFTEAGTKLHAASRNAVIAFEVDSLNDQEGWSVLVIGRSFLCEDDSVITKLRAAGLQAVAPGIRSELVGVSIQHVSGRRFAFGLAATDDSGYL